MAQRIGQKISVRGQDHVITGIRPAGEGKFFGRHVFVLRRISDNTYWRGYGKMIAHNSKLSPAGVSETV